MKKKKAPAARAMAKTIKMICTLKSASYEEKERACGARNGQQQNNCLLRIDLYI